jgi:hypothetical protein
LSFAKVPLDDRDPANRRVGRLHFLGGWAIRSNDGRFGGISAMHVAQDEVTALSDAGWLLRFSLPGSRGSAPSIVPLPEAPGHPRVKGDRDVEAMAVHGSNAWLAFEGRNEIWRYDIRSWKSEAAAAPAAMGEWPINGGSEAMIRLADGRFLLFSEGERRPDGSSAVLLFSTDPTRADARALSLGYRAPEGYRITDAALLPGGAILFLNRRVAVAGGVSAKLSLAENPDLRAGAVLRGEEIAHFQAPITVDNMEALSVAREGARTILWIGSDDNYIPLQRTLLMKFALSDGTRSLP